MSTTTFKVFAPSGHVCRRISYPTVPRIEAIEGVVESMVDAPHAKLNLVYVDSDGDRVIIKTQSDIEEAVRDAKATGDKAIKLQVCARSHPCNPRGDPGNARAGNKKNRCTNNNSGDAAGTTGPGQRGRRHCPWRPGQGGQRCGRGFFLGHPWADPLLWGGELKEIGEVIEAMLHPFGVRRSQGQRTQTCEPAGAACGGDGKEETASRAPPAATTTTPNATATSAADATRPTTTPVSSAPEVPSATPAMPAPTPSLAAQTHTDNVGHTEEGQVVVQADEDGQAKDDAEEDQAQDNNAPADSLEEEGEYVKIDHAAREEESDAPNNRPTVATADGAKETAPVPPVSPEDVATTSAAEVGEEEARDELDAKAVLLREMGFDIPHDIARDMIAEMGGRMDLIVRALVANSK